MSKLRPIDRRIEVLDHAPDVPHAAADHAGGRMRVIRPGRAVLAVEIDQAGDARLERLELRQQRLGVVVAEVLAAAIPADPRRLRRPQDRLGERRLRILDRRRDHRRRQAGLAGQVDGAGQLLLHPLRRDVAALADVPFDGVEPGLLGHGDGALEVGPLQVPRDDADRTPGGRSPPARMPWRVTRRPAPPHPAASVRRVATAARPSSVYRLAGYACARYSATSRRSSGVPWAPIATISSTTFFHASGVRAGGDRIVEAVAAGADALGGRLPQRHALG